MPVMLRAAGVNTWLSSERATACELAVPFAYAEMRQIDS